MEQKQTDFSKLRGRIIEKFGSQQSLASAMGMPNSTLTTKLKNKSKFNTDDLDKLIVLLEIPKEEIWDYFFTK